MFAGTANHRLPESLAAAPINPNTNARASESNANLMVSSVPFHSCWPYPSRNICAKAGIHASVAMDIEIEIFLRDCLVGTVFEQFSQRLVDEIFQIDVAFSKSYR